MKMKEGALTGQEHERKLLGNGAPSGEKGDRKNTHTTTRISRPLRVAHRMCGEPGQRSRGVE